MSIAPTAVIHPETTLDRHLVRRFLAGHAGVEELPAPRWGPIGREVYERTYSRDIPTADGSIRKETWAETTRRVVLGNTGFAPSDSLLPDEAAELFELIFAFKAIPAGRHLWVTGTQNPFSRNCWCSGFSARTSDHFAYLASRLFEGGGVGSNYSHDLLALTCPVLDQLRVAITCSPEHVDFEQVRSCSGDLWAEPGSDLPGHATLHRTEDSREGWVATWVEMIDLACTPGDHTLLIDLSDVREFGAPLKTFGGTASGPGPLATAISGITRGLSGAAGRRLTGLESMTIDQEIAASVVAGGTRRSARMSMMVWDDPQVFEFISCKASWTEHWTTNISVEVDDRFHAALAAGDPHAGRVLTAVATRMAADGEPGLVDSSAHSIGEPTPIRVTNPCSEIGLQFDTLDAAGESCNIGSVDLAAFGTDHLGASRAFRLMARFLLRATLNPYPGEAPGRIERRNRRIGVGIMGLQGWLAAHGAKMTEFAGDQGLREVMTGFRMATRSSADTFADTLGIPRPVKVTAVAPTGSIAQLGGTGAGIHPAFARFFIRRVRYSCSDPKLVELAAKGYTIVDDVYAANTKVVEFPQQELLAARYGELIEQADEISAADFLAMQLAVQLTLCGGTDGNAVSSTGAIPEGMDPAALETAIRSVLGHGIKGITCFPEASGRALSPYERITQEQFEAMSAALFNAELASLTGDSNSGECAGGACPIR